MAVPVDLAEEVGELAEVIAMMRVTVGDLYAPAGDFYRIVEGNGLPRFSVQLLKIFSEPVRTSKILRMALRDDLQRLPPNRYRLAERIYIPSQFIPGVQSHGKITACFRPMWVMRNECPGSPPPVTDRVIDQRRVPGPLA